MARTIEFVVTETSGTAMLSLDDVPDEVKQEMEEMYAAQKANANGRFRITFDTKQELLQYVAQANAYAAQRPAGAIRFRKSPTRGLADNVGDFRVTDLPANGTDEIRDATAAVSKQEGPAPVPTVPAKKTTTTRRK